MAGRVLDSVRFELRGLKRIAGDLVFFGLLVAAVAFLQRVVLCGLAGSVATSSLGSTALFLFGFNSLAYAVMVYASYIVLWRAPLVAVERCMHVWLPDCRVWTSMSSSAKARAAVASVFALPLLILVAYNSFRLAAGGGMLGFWEVIWSSFKRLYGVFEFSGYAVGILSQAPAGLSWRIVFSLAGLALLAVGAYMEATLLYGG